MAVSRREHQRGDTPAPDVAPSSIGSGLLLTAGAWLVTRLVVGISYSRTRRPFAGNPLDWMRWDSVNYLSIAQHGRTFGRCDSPQFKRTPNPLGVKWCGTAGWLPGYPRLLSVLHALHLDYKTAALAISWCAVAILLFLVWYGWCRQYPAPHAFAVMLLVGLFPGAVYNFALFPTSLALVLVVGALIAASRDHWLFAALLMAGAGLCYPSAWFAAMGLAAGLVALGAQSGITAMVRRGLYGLLGLAGLLIIVATDHPWNAFFLMDRQQGLRASSNFPGQDFLRLLFTGSTAEQQFLGDWTRWVLSLQGFLAVAITVTAGVLAIVAWRRRTADGWLVYPAATGLAVIAGILVLNANGGAWNRSVVLAAPSALCLRKLPTAVVAVLVVAVGITTATVSNGFFDGRLV